MRIAQVCPRFPPYTGGIETHVYEISKRLAREFDVEVLSTDPAGKKMEEMDSIVVKRFKCFAPSESYYLSPSLYYYLKKNSSRYEIMHAHGYHAFPALHAAMAKKENKLIFTPHYHGKGHSFVRNLLHKPYKLLGSKIFKKADAVICVSEHERNLVLKNFKIEAHVIPNGIDLDEFKTNGIKKSGNGSRKILYVGRLEKYKGIDYIVETLTRLGNEFIFDIVGKGPYKQKIIRFAEKLGVLNRINFYKDLSRRELVKKYAEADVLVLLSRYEAYGLAVAEALAAELPCIVANEAALKEWVDGRSVFGIDYPIDIEELAELIKKVAGKTVKNDRLLSWDDVVKQIKRVYGL